jgi:hypothetical protein
MLTRSDNAEAESAKQVDELAEMVTMGVAVWMRIINAI